jgi:hypothetical protein
MDPQQELFIKLKTDLEAQGFSVYDGFLPPDGTPYPFVYLGDSNMTDDANKSAVFGNVFQTIHVWHNDPHKRGTVSAMLLAIKKVCRAIEHTPNFAWSVRGVNQQILPDNTTKPPLLHGVLEVEWKFS